jgi:hypothetical protein
MSPRIKNHHKNFFYFQNDPPPNSWVRHFVLNPPIQKNEKNQPRMTLLLIPGCALFCWMCVSAWEAFHRSRADYVEQIQKESGNLDEHRKLNADYYVEQIQKERGNL